MKSIILASASIYRKQQLEGMGLKVKAIASNIDEDGVKDSGLTPLQIAEQLSVLKAKEIAKNCFNEIVIGGDQLISFEGDIIGKAGSKEKAIEQLINFSGKTHDIITSIAVLYKNTVEVITEVSSMTMKKISISEAENYIEKDKAWDCAGSYKIELNGKDLFSDIKTDDFTSIQGIPEIKLKEYLQSL